MAAKDDDVEDALDEEPKGKKLAKKKDEAPKPGTPHIVLRIILGLSGLLLLIGFFFPWLRLNGADNQVDLVSGLDIVVGGNAVVRAFLGQEWQSYLLLLIPGFGVALTAVGFLGVRYSGQIAAVLGILIVGYGMVMMIIFFFQRTGFGLWMILGGAFIAILAGVVTFVRTRVDPNAPAKRKPD
ncbi:MAG: hypothetical protein H6719_20400 [Sandaracinaceae bacterium]|nr:hypothetical protein [Sandaracinaceae bacterium]